MAERECHHVERVREVCGTLGVRLYSEHGTDPPGWLNAHCEQCKRTYEIRPIRPVLPEGTDNG